MKTKLILYSIVIFVSSCVINEDILTKQRTDYMGKEFKTGGCYFHQLSDTVCHYYFFYRNGIRLELHDSVNINSVDQFDLRGIKNYRACWAIFSVENNTITSTYWNGDEFGDFYIDFSNTTKEYFKIENDSTLSTINLSNKTIYYHFQKFVSKPDSINRFIK